MCSVKPTGGPHLRPAATLSSKYHSIARSVALRFEGYSQVRLRLGGLYSLVTFVVARSRELLVVALAVRSQSALN